MPPRRRRTGEPGKPSRLLVKTNDEMGADSLVAERGRAFAAAPTVGALEDLDRFYAREFPQMVNVAYALSGSRISIYLIRDGKITLHSFAQ